MTAVFWRIWNDFIFEIWQKLSFFAGRALWRQGRNGNFKKSAKIQMGVWVMFLFVAMNLKLKHVESHVALTCSKTVILPNFVSNYGNVIFQNVKL